MDSRARKIAARDGEQMKAFVINLARATERRASFLAAANAHGWEVEVVPAVDWRELHAEPQDDGSRMVRQVKGDLQIAVACDGPHSLGAVACALSHISLWRRIVAEGLPEACIFEDDAQLTSAWHGKPLPADADMVFISDRVSALNPGDLDESELDAWCQRTPYAPLVPGCGTEAYIITAKGGGKALEIMNPLRVPIDLQLMAAGHGTLEAGHSLVEYRIDGQSLSVYATTEVFTTHDNAAFSYIQATV